MKVRNTVKFRLPNLFIIISICSIFLISCKNDSLELDIKWETSEKEYLKKMNSKVEKEEYKVNIGDFQENCYTKSYSIGGKDFIFDLYINNSDEVTSGSFRSYTYDIGTTQAKLFLNDTTNTSYSSIRGISKVDFDFLKNYLDDCYGVGKEIVDKSPPNSLFPYENHTWNYTGKDFDISIYRSELGTLRPDEQKKLKIIIPFYIGAQITFQSKNYDKLNKQEVQKRIKTLKPKDVLIFNWEDPYLIPDNYGGTVVFKVNDERYICNFLHKKILQCKGDLIIKDAYGDIIKSGEVDYIFSSPLTPPWEIGPSTTPQSFSLTGNGEEVNKMRKMIRNHVRINIEFDIKAIALEDGSTIRK